MGKMQLCKKKIVNMNTKKQNINWKKEKKKGTWYLQPQKRKSNTNLYIVICQKVNENNHIKLSYNPKYKEKEEHYMVHTYQS